MWLPVKSVQWRRLLGSLLLVIFKILFKVFFFPNFVYFLILIFSFSLFKHFHRLTLSSVGVFPYYFLLQVEFACNFVFPIEMGFVASNTISVQKRPLP